MKIVYAITYWGMTGGVKVLTQHVRALRERGHDVRLITRVVEESWESSLEPEVVPSFSNRDVPAADALVVTAPRDVEALWPVAKRRGIPLFHFLQGFEPDYNLQRISGRVIPDRYRGTGPIARLRHKIRIRNWKRELRWFDRLYRLPTIKMAISPHIAEGVVDRYNLPCFFVPNGIDRGVFHPKRTELGYTGGLTILSVGNYSIEYKRIPDVHEAVRILKQRGVPVRLVRVSPAPIPDEERRTGAADEYRVKIPEAEIAELYRQSHFYISPSTEIEGFGLPPVEAMSSGTPVILTRVAPFLSFDEPHDYARFVDVYRPERIADAVMELAGDDALRNNIVRRGCEVAEKYSLKRTGDLLEGIIHENRGKTE
ncbi:MAG: glycosyltransferase family 4 protein [Deltaproteobacteria bacterium]|nr:glycosyltransferase family 4 protein [Candidatus Zymogenaceae bacterium]